MCAEGVKKSMNRKKFSFKNNSLKIISFILTIVWLFMLLFPVYLMFITSLKDDSVQYAETLDLGVDLPKKYTVVLDYTAEEYEQLGVDGIYRDANLVLWRLFDFQISGIGKAQVIATIDNKPVVSYSLSKSTVGINEYKMWKKSRVETSDIDRNLIHIEESGYVKIKEKDVSLPEKQYRNEYSESMLTTCLENPDISGKVVDCTYCNSPGNLFDNFAIAWRFVERANVATGMFGPIINTIFVAFTTFVLTVFICSLAAYSISKLLPYSLKAKFMIFIIASGMIPGTVTIIPKYMLMQVMGLENSLLAIILPAIGSFTAMVLFKGTFDAYPDAVLEAARVDGASEFYLFVKFALPSAKGVVGVQALTIFITAWSDYFWPSMVIRNPDKYTISMVLNYAMNVATDSTYTITLAMAFIISIPTLIIFAFFQKYLAYGFDYSGIKG